MKTARGGGAAMPGPTAVSVAALQALTLDDLRRIASGYVSGERYRVRLDATDAGGWRIALDPAPVDPPKVKRFAHDAAALAHLQPGIAARTSLGAWDGGLLVGIAVAEPMAWNCNLVLHEFHVAESHRRRGIGRAMMERVVAVARASGCRAVTAETQNTNAPAIHFYRSCGFVLQGVDLSLYADDHLGEDREVALYMRRFV